MVKPSRINRFKFYSFEQFRWCFDKSSKKIGTATSRNKKCECPSASSQNDFCEREKLPMEQIRFQFSVYTFWSLLSFNYQTGLRAIVVHVSAASFFARFHVAELCYACYFCIHTRHGNFIWYAAVVTFAIPIIHSFQLVVFPKK